VGKIILILNSGSSSLKYELMQMPERKRLGKGLVERIGTSMGKITQTCGEKKVSYEMPFPDHKVAMNEALKLMSDKDSGIIKDTSEIKAVGHRVLHGGSKCIESMLVTDDVIKHIEEAVAWGPLHNPPNLIGIREAQKRLPGVPQVAVFDTAFHHTMPPHVYMYPLPKEYYKKYGIRRYGFHGTSHKFVSKRTAEILKKDPKDLNMITCHLGNGSSLAAVKGGKVFDTSMGLTPLEGLMMGTRCGDIDPAILPYLAKHGFTAAELDNIMNKKSGLLGISCLTNDMRDIEDAAEKGNKDAQLALDMFVYRVKKYLGSYMAALGKTDVIVFTGGIGENDGISRRMICENMESLGIVLDLDKNEGLRGTEAVISKPESKILVMTVPTNEELQIALDVYEIVFEGK